MAEIGVKQTLGFARLAGRYGRKADIALPRYSVLGRTTPHYPLDFASTPSIAVRAIAAAE